MKQHPADDGGRFLHGASKSVGSRFMPSYLAAMTDAHGEPCRVPT